MSAMLAEEPDDGAWVAAHIERHLRDGVAAARDAYGPQMDFEAARRCLLMQMDALGMPEELVYPTVDRVENWHDMLAQLTYPE